MDVKFEFLTLKALIASQIDFDDLQSFLDEHIKENPSVSRMYRKRISELFEEIVDHSGEFNMKHEISVETLKGQAYSGMTPDFYDSVHLCWADAAVSGVPELTHNHKFEKYKEILSLDEESYKTICLNPYDGFVYTYHEVLQLHELPIKEHYWMPKIEAPRMFSNLPIVEGEVKITKSFSYTRKTVRKEPIDIELQKIFFCLINIYDITAPSEDTGVNFRKFEIEYEKELCKEVQEVSLASKGDLINWSIENYSFDTDDDVFNNSHQWIKLLHEQKVEYVKNQIGKKDVLFTTTSKDKLFLAFNNCEEKVKNNYIVVEKAKISIHLAVALPSKAILDLEGDTKLQVYNKALEELQGARSYLFFELKTLFKTALRDDGEIDLGISSMKMKRNSELHKFLKIGERKYHKFRKGNPDDFLKVKTVPFWGRSHALEFETYLRSKLHEAPCIVYSPHRLRQPELKSERVKRLYNKFIKTELFQEIGLRASLAQNMLSAGATARKGFTFISSGSDNCFVILGPGGGLYSSGVTVPFFCVTKGQMSNGIVPDVVASSHNGWNIHQAERLDKVRLKTLSISAMLAAIVATIVFCEARAQTDEQLIYTAGVLACVAASVNIRDSELIDHLRYMIPNIFADLSCATLYVEDKFASPLKTSLQAYLYKEMRKTILESADLKRTFADVQIEDGEIIGGGSKLTINLFGSTLDSVFKLNGLVYSMFFTCAKGLHNPKTEKLKMLETIMKYNEMSDKKTLTEAMTDGGYHSFDPEFVFSSMADMISSSGTLAQWRNRLDTMQSLRKPFQLKTFSSLKSSLKQAHKLEETLDQRQDQKTKKSEGEREPIFQAFKDIWADSRTRVLDQFFDKEEPIYIQALNIMNEEEEPKFYATWDQKRQRTGRDREIFILDTKGKTLMFMIESLFRMISEYVTEEKITIPGDKKVVSLKADSTLYYEIIKDAINNDIEYDYIRSSEDMTKWAPGDNLCKFFFAIGACSFLKKHEKRFFLNVLASSLRKYIIINSQATEKMTELVLAGVVKEDSLWPKNLKATIVDGYVVRFENNLVPTRLNWLMGVLNLTSSAVHASIARAIRKVLEAIYGRLVMYRADTHSDDAASNVIVKKNVYYPLASVYPNLKRVALELACIKISEKKTYFDRFNCEFVSQINDYGRTLSYWQKQAPAVITGNSYRDFYTDLSSQMSKVANLCSQGAPPSVVQVSMSIAIDHSHQVYGLLPTQRNFKALNDLDVRNLPLELGGVINMNPYLLPFVGIKYHAYKKMADAVLKEANKHRKQNEKKLDILDIDEHHIPEDAEGPLEMHVWAFSLELAMNDGALMTAEDSPIIRFNNFSNREAVENLKLFSAARDFPEMILDQMLEDDPTLLIRQGESTQEKLAQLAVMIRRPGFYNALTQQSPDQIYLERIRTKYGKCCWPALGENVMEEARSDLPNAIRTAYAALNNKYGTLRDCFKLISAMPLMKFVYASETLLTFSRSGPRTLYPVLKTNVVKDRLVENDVLNLLRYKFSNAKVLSKLKPEFLEDDLEVINFYESKISETFNKIQKTQILHSILSNISGFNSVLFVPHHYYEGGRSVWGMLCNSFHDDYAYQQHGKIELPKINLNNFYQVKLSDQASSLASGLMQITRGNTEKVRTILSLCKFGNLNSEALIKKYRHQEPRQLAYFMAVMKGYLPELGPRRNKVFYISAQRMEQKKFIGPFLVYMDVRTYENAPRRGIFIEGLDDKITGVKLTNDFSEYPDIKSILRKFMEGMFWRGSISSHIKYSDDPNDFSVVVETYQMYSEQVHVRSSCVGIPCQKVKEGMPAPGITLDKITDRSIYARISLGEKLIEQRTYRQRLFDLDNVEVFDQIKVGPWNFRKFLNKVWDPIKRRQKVDPMVLIDSLDLDRPLMYSYNLRQLAMQCNDGSQVIVQNSSSIETDEHEYLVLPRLNEDPFGQPTKIEKPLDVYVYNEDGEVELAEVREVKHEGKELHEIFAKEDQTIKDINLDDLAQFPPLVKNSEIDIEELLLKDDDEELSDIEDLGSEFDWAEQEEVEENLFDFAEVENDVELVEEDLNELVEDVQVHERKTSIFQTEEQKERKRYEKIYEKDHLSTNEISPFLFSITNSLDFTNVYGSISMEGKFVLNAVISSAFHQGDLPMFLTLTFVSHLSNHKFKLLDKSTLNDLIINPKQAKKHKKLIQTGFFNWILTESEESESEDDDYGELV